MALCKQSCRLVNSSVRTCLSTSASLSSTKEPDSPDSQLTPAPDTKKKPYFKKHRKRVAHSWFKHDEVNVGAPWPSVWQGPRSFDPYSVPFSLQMGTAVTGEPPPQGVGNLELMKIPNFLHLSPPAIFKHCEALKPLCTPFPEKIPFMPLTIETRNYVFPSHSVKHPGSKLVLLSFRVSDLKLSERARKKMIQLAGKRYKEDCDEIRIRADRCPTRAQNHDYAMYLLKVLYLESNKVEPWEESEEGVAGGVAETERGSD